MCGITGLFIPKKSAKTYAFQSTIDRMTDALQHRGPDSRGTWVDNERSVAFGHRRLAIRDLSTAGHQPMFSSCGRFVIVYNGEIYSHGEIKKKLAQCGRHTKGSSDTEVILEACAQWGIEAAVEQLIGMFAFALFDKKLNRIYLARDRLGIKPLYWGNTKDIFFFGSELKALRAVQTWTPTLNRNAVAAFMRHNYIPAPHSIYEGVYKLEPGSILTMDSQEQAPKITYFWKLRHIVEKNINQLDQRTEKELVGELDILLQDAVQRRLITDVPLGALLSGGIDSSLVTALMAEQSTQPIKTFSIGFKENSFNEAPYAKKIAQYLKTDHTELYVEPTHALSVIDKLQHLYDEPFADSSQIPTFLLCELTKKYVTVALSGDGGDELFAGYNRYSYGLNVWKQANIAPYFARKFLANSVLKVTSGRWDSIACLFPSRFFPPQFGTKLHKVANGLLLNDPDDMYRKILSHWHDPDQLVIDAKESKGILWDDSVRSTIPHFLDRMQFLDTATYLPDDILTKVDRASMGTSLEIRVPLLDHRVVEFAWKMPRNTKLRKNETKWALRQILYKRIPRELIERPKMGFAVPLEQWLRGPLREWAEGLLNESRLRAQNLFVPELITQRWQAHLRGENWSYPLWNVLVMQAWLNANEGIQW